MALATTCPQCKTSFRIVPDQLDRGRGMVRCGVCKHAFAGADHLRYIDEPDRARRTDANAEDSTTTPVAPRQQDDPVSAATGTREPGSARPGPALPGSALPGSALPGSALPGPALPGFALPPAAASRAPAAGAAPEPRLGAGAPLFPPPAEGEWDPLEAIGAPERDGDRLVASRNDGYSAGPARYAAAAGAGMSSADPASRPAGSSPRPSRLDPRHDPMAAGLPYPAKTGAHEGTQTDPHAIFTQAPSNWHANPKRAAPDDDRIGASARPGPRRYSLIALVVLLVLAAAQLALLFRSEIANAVPALRPAAELFAAAFGLKIEAPRNLASLSIESTELQRGAGSGNAALHALLRNKDSRTVRWPAMELTLTDQAGAVVLRKVILPAQYLPASAPRDGLRALSEVPIRMGLDPGSLAIANYSVRLFYP